jgi:hypothetical protein
MGYAKSEHIHPPRKWLVACAGVVLAKTGSCCVSLALPQFLLLPRVYVRVLPLFRDERDSMPA